MTLINYCKLGLLSTCMKADNPIMQRVCHFAHPVNGINKTEDQYCIHLRRDLDNHCDNSKAQQAARDGNNAEVVKTLNEEDVFDVKNNKTYPIY